MDATKTSLAIPAAAAWVMQVIYMISPIDLIPDLIPILGLADDLLGLLLVLAFTAFVIYRNKKLKTTPDTTNVNNPPKKRASSKGEIINYEPLSLEELRAL